MSAIDIARFDSALRAAYPGIRFLKRDYLRHWEECVYRDPLPGEKWPALVSSRMRPPHGDPMPYLPSLSDHGGNIVLAWVEPSGWRPQWSDRPLRSDNYLILNKPDLRFHFRPSQYCVVGLERRTTWMLHPPSSLEYEEFCMMTDGDLDGPYLFYEEEQIEFLNGVWRIMRRLTTNDLASVDPRTLHSFARVRLESQRAGHDAAEWTRQDRRHLLGYGPSYCYRVADAYPLVSSTTSQ